MLWIPVSGIGGQPVYLLCNLSHLSCLSVLLRCPGLSCPGLFYSVLISSLLFFVRFCPCLGLFCSGLSSFRFCSSLLFCSVLGGGEDESGFVI